MKDELPERVEARVRRALEETGLTRRILVVAVSGGPDSLALLYALHRLQGDLGLKLHVAHLDHGLRGAEGEADARFVEDTARSLGLPYAVERADVPAYRRQRRLSLEAAARECRYAFLARVASQVQAAAVALGHTADDQAETVLLHLLRGSGLYGQRGMQPLSLWQGPDGSRVTLLRPLLELSRQETEAYCCHLGLVPRFDTSNRSLSLARNRLRRDLLPRLQGYNPRVKEALQRLAGIAAREVEFLQSEVARVWPTLSRRQGEARVLDTLRVRALHPGLWRHVLRRAYEEVTGSAQGLEEVHLEAMVGLLEGPPGRSLHLPGGVVLVTGYGQLTLGRGSLGECPLPALAGSHRLKVPGMTALPGWWVTAVVAPPPAELPTDPLTACLAPQAVGAELLVRARRPGDRFQPLGMEESKKLQDFFVDQKVPRTWRGRVPLVLAEGGIVWVVGYRIAHWARLPQGARQALVLRFRQEG